MNDAMTETDDIELMFLKGHVSPKPPVEDAEVFNKGCYSHCPMKEFLFDYIAQIDCAESDEEKITAYLHICDDMLEAVSEVQDRLDELIH